jgi:phage baseplate assembly protein W
MESSGLVGLRLPLRADKGRGLVPCQTEEEHIHQSIAMIVRTRPGSRPLYPDYGCRIHELLFRPLTPALQSQMAFFVRQALERFEKRIGIDEVSTAQQQEGGAAVADEVVLTIRYRLRQQPEAVEAVPRFAGQDERELRLRLSNGTLLLRQTS